MYICWTLNHVTYLRFPNMCQIRKTPSQTTSWWYPILPRDMFVDLLNSHGNLNDASKNRDPKNSHFNTGTYDNLMDIWGKPISTQSHTTNTRLAQATAWTAPMLPSPSAGMLGHSLGLFQRWRKPLRGLSGYSSVP